MRQHPAPAFTEACGRPLLLQLIDFPTCRCNSRPGAGTFDLSGISDLVPSYARFAKIAIDTQFDLVCLEFNSG